MPSLFVVGTDTDAGKTVLLTALFAYCKKYAPNRSVALLKPIQSGSGDRELYQRLFKLSQTLDEINPLYFTAPLASPIAAAQEHRHVEIERAWTTYQSLTQRYNWVLVEGAGSLGSPMTGQTTGADLAADWRLRIVIVVPVKLGAIGQVVAAVALAERSNLQILGIVRSCLVPCTDEEIENLASQDLIETLTGIQVLGTLPYLADSEDIAALAQAASNLDLELLMPGLI